MRKRVLVLLIGCALSVVGSVGVADAQFIAEVCWQKQPFTDILRLGLSQSGSQIIATGVQFFNGAGPYSLPFAGSLFIIGSQAILGGTLTGDLVNFGGSSAVALTATLSTSTGSGPSTAIGIDGKFALGNTTLVIVACPAGPTGHDAGTATSGKPEGR